MKYEDSFEALKGALDKCSLPYEMHFPRAAEETKLVHDVFGQTTATAIARIGYIGGVEFPWVVETFFLYALIDIPGRQTGYRAAQSSARGKEAWPDSRWVIGDWGADPVSVDARAPGPVSWSRHGRGAWAFHEVSADFGDFLLMLAKWLEFFVVDMKRDILNEDFEVGETKKDSIRQKVLDHLDPARRERALSFLAP